MPSIPFRPWRLSESVAMTALLLACSVAMASAAQTEHAAAPVNPLDETALDIAELEQAALVSLHGLFDELRADRTLRFEIVDLRAIPDSMASLSLDGVGRMSIGAGDWIPLRFSAGYDVRTGSTYAARIDPIVTVASRHPTPRVGASIREQVEGQIASRILREFPDQQVELSFGEYETLSDSYSHLAVRGEGRADFARFGVAPVRFNAILDRRSGLLMTVSYTLDDFELQQASELGDAAIAVAH